MGEITGVFLASTKQIAENLMETYRELKRPFVIQEFIKESKGTDIRAFVVGGKIVASMQRIANEGEFRSNIHRGGTGIKAKLTKEEEEVCLKACECLGLKIAGVDFLRSNRGALVLEINSSPGLEGIEKYTRVDVASKVIKYLEEL